MKKTIQKTKLIALPYQSIGYAIAPNIILRSPLFPAVDVRSPPVMLSKKQIYEDKKITLSFTGYQLNQSDFDVWLALIQNANHQIISNYEMIPIQENELLSLIGRSASGSNYQWLRRSIEKLAISFITIDHKNLDAFGGHLINEYAYSHDLGQWRYSLSKELIGLFTPGNWSQVNWAIRKRINKYPTAMWLHSFYASHQPSNIPIGIDHVHKICGSTELKMSNFKKRLVLSSEILTDACQSEGKSFDATFIKQLMLVKHSF